MASLKHKRQSLVWEQDNANFSPQTEKFPLWTGQFETQETICSLWTGQCQLLSTDWEVPTQTKACEAHRSTNPDHITQSCPTIDIQMLEAVTHAIQWLASQRDAQITHAIILTDPMNQLQKVDVVEIVYIK